MKHVLPADCVANMQSSTEAISQNRARSEHDEHARAERGSVTRGRTQIGQKHDEFYAGPVASRYRLRGTGTCATPISRDPERCIAIGRLAERLLPVGRPEFIDL